MGCYGIGVSRIVAAAIEQNFDARGIVFPEPMAPFAVSIVPLGMQKSPAVAQAANSLYDGLREAGVDALLDDRDERPGVLLADHELIGVPLRVVIGDRGLKEGVVEIQGRREASATKVLLSQALETIKSRL